MAEAATRVEFTLPIGGIAEEHRAEAERKAREAFVMALLRQGEISAGRAATVLEVDRWALDELMSAYGVSPFDENLTPEELAGGIGFAQPK